MPRALVLCDYLGDLLVSLRVSSFEGRDSPLLCLDLLSDLGDLRRGSPLPSSSARPSAS
jgi:hypothetical protein